MRSGSAEAICTVPSSCTLMLTWKSSCNLRMTAPPLPMMSRIFSGLILIVVMRGAKSESSGRAVLMIASILSRISRRAASASLRPVRMIAPLIPCTLMSICKAVIPVRVPVTLKSMSPKASSLPRMSVRTMNSPSGSDIRPIAAPATDALSGTPASRSERLEPQVEAIEVDPLEVTHSETTRMAYGNSSIDGSTGISARSARAPCPISRRPGPRIGLFSPVLYGGML